MHYFSVKNKKGPLIPALKKLADNISSYQKNVCYLFSSIRYQFAISR